MGQSTSGTLALDAGRETRVTIPRDEAIASLFDAHYHHLWRLATLLLGDPHQGEEAVQDAFVHTYAGWLRIRHPERAEHYLRAAVVNQCRTRGRKGWRAERVHAIVASTLPKESAPDAQDALGDALNVLAAVRALPDRQREAVVLTYYADLKLEDVARALGCSVGTVKSQLSKARATLARRLEDDVEGTVGRRA